MRRVVIYPTQIDNTGLASRWNVTVTRDKANKASNQFHNTDTVSAAIKWINGRFRKCEIMFSHDNEEWVVLDTDEKKIEVMLSYG